MKPRAAAFCLGIWIMGTVCISVAATQNFYTIDRLLAAGGHPSFADGVEQLGAPAARDLLRYLSSELNRLFFRYWNLVQIPLGGVTLWLVLGPSGDRRLRWLVGAMLGIALVLTLVVTPPIISIGRGLDFVPRDPPPPDLARFGILHAAYTTLEMLKAAMGACAAYLVCRGTGSG